MLYGILIMFFALSTYYLYHRLCVKPLKDPHDQVFAMYFGILIPIATSLPLAALVIYLLMKLGLVSGYFGM